MKSVGDTEKEVFKATERMYVLEQELAGRGFKESATHVWCQGKK